MVVGRMYDDVEYHVVRFSAGCCASPEYVTPAEVMSYRSDVLLITRDWERARELAMQDYLSNRYNAGYIDTVVYEKYLFLGEHSAPVKVLSGRRVTEWARSMGLL